MPAYRLYCLDATGDIDFADTVEASDDDVATYKARLLNKQAVSCEVWEGDRLVASLGAPDLAEFRHPSCPFTLQP